MEIPSPFLAAPSILLIGLVLDAWLGEPDWLWRRMAHPVVLIGRLAARLEAAWNRPTASARMRLIAGGGTVLVVVGITGGLGVGIDRLDLPGVNILVLAVMVAQRGLWDHVVAVADGLVADGCAGGRRAVAMIVGRNPETLDEAGVCRAAIESCAENFSDGVVAPTFWFALAGPTGILVYKAVNTLDSMIGHRSEHYLHFGRIVARLDDAANWVPARLAGGLIALAATVSGNMSGRKAWRIMVRDARRHRSPNAGWQEAAMAGALDLTLAGPRRYGTERVQDPFLGDNPRTATETDIRRAARLMATACVGNAMLCGAIAAGRAVL